jgi:hypothetical protein
LLRVAHTGAPRTDSLTLLPIRIGTVSPSAISNVMLVDISRMTASAKNRVDGYKIGSAWLYAKRAIFFGL